MADNTIINATTQAGGVTYRDVDKAGIKTQVVTLDLGGAGAEALVAGTLPVTGTFFQATQPVSGPVTDTQLRATAVPISGTVTANAGTGTLAVSLATAPTTPVTGTFFQAAQPVTDNAGSLTVDAPVGTPVFVRLSDGTAAIATLPVSLASNTPDVTDRAGRLLGVATLGAGTAEIGKLAAGTAAIGSVILGAGTAEVGKLAAGVASIGTVVLTAETTKVIGTVNQAAITKGTQGANGVTTQDLKDAGRVMFTATGTAIAGVTAEALITLTPYRDLVAGTAGSTHPVTSAKRLRLQSMTLSLRSTSTVNVGCLVRFRMLAGTVLVGSPVHNSIGGQSSNLATAVIGNAGSYQVNFPDGFELSGTMQFGLTQLASATSATLDIHVTGYEY